MSTPIPLCGALIERSAIGTPATGDRRYRQRVDLATCTFDSVPLRVQEQRKGDKRGPVLVCPSCGRRFTMGSSGPEEVPTEPDRPA